jgi:hypothetical protein
VFLLAVIFDAASERVEFRSRNRWRERIGSSGKVNVDRVA